jgi:hypothetical protein
VSVSLAVEKQDFSALGRPHLNAQKILDDFFLIILWASGLRKGRRRAGCLSFLACLHARTVLKKKKKNHLQTIIFPSIESYNLKTFSSFSWLFPRSSVFFLSPTPPPWFFSDAHSCRSFFSFSSLLAGNKIIFRRSMMCTSRCPAAGGHSRSHTVSSILRIVIAYPCLFLRIFSPPPKKKINKKQKSCSAWLVRIPGDQRCWHPLAIAGSVQVSHHRAQLNGNSSLHPARRPFRWSAGQHENLLCHQRWLM